MDDVILNERAILKGNVSMWSRLDVGGLAMFGTTVSFADGSTHGSYLKTSEASTTLNSIINTNSSQDTSINDILTTLPSFLQSATASSTYQPVGKYALNATLNKYTSTVSLTLTSIIIINASQDTSINNILNTLPSFPQSATASSTYQQRAFGSAVIPVGTAGLVSGVVWNGSATNFEVSKLSGLGSYRFQWSPAIPYSYLFFGNLRNAAGFVSFNGAGTVGLNCQTYVANGTQSDIASGYHIMIIRNP